MARLPRLDVPGYRNISYSAATTGARASSTTRTTSPTWSLREASRKFDCAIHAYVLMTNHAHGHGEEQGLGFGHDAVAGAAVCAIRERRVPAHRHPI
jgi:hypothetical protein